MSEIDWSLAPEGATKLVQESDFICWAKDGCYWDVVTGQWEEDSNEKRNLLIATRPTQTKTVADAVEWKRNGGNICGESFTANKMLSFCKANGSYCFVSELSSAGSVETDDWQPVCTREQFEAYVKEREGEKWTHTNSHGEKFKFDFKLACGEGVYLREDGKRIVDGKLGYSKLKPIKPKLTKAQAWDKMKSLSRGGISYAYARIVDEHEITD